MARVRPQRHTRRAEKKSIRGRQCIIDGLLLLLQHLIIILDERSFSKNCRPARSMPKSVTGDNFTYPLVRIFIANVETGDV
jgi:hypothetical protein